jgi:DNA-binding NtrC family response regulator
MRFLLLDGEEESDWTTFLADALAPLGTLRVARAGEWTRLDGDEPDGLILIDATAVENVERLVSSLRLERPARRIVVMTASPTWRRARAAFEAGAIDYLHKTLSRDELRKAFEQILDRPAPPWAGSCQNKG